MEIFETPKFEKFGNLEIWKLGNLENLEVWET